MKKIIIAETVKRALGDQDTFFRRGSVELYSGRTSEELLELQRTCKADLIITEYSLPVMNGAALCSLIRGEADLREVSIIMVCDEAESILPVWQEKGPNAIVVKPVNPAELFSRMSELLVVPQRQEIRAILRASVNGHEGNSTFLGALYNISISGLLLETDRMLSLGDRMTFSIDIGHREIVADCVVMRLDKSVQGKFRYGAKFQNLDTKSLVLIDQYVRGNVKQ